MSKHRIKLLSGGFFDFVDMDQSQFTVEDLSNNISRICRFNGALNKHYSVSQHSIYVSDCVPDKYKLGALCHDLAEGVMGDMASPLKMIQPAFRKLEKQVEKQIFGRLGIEFPLHSCIKLADLRVLAGEVRDLQPSASDWPAIAEIEPYEKKIVPWSAEKANREFLKRFYQLTENK